MEKVGGRTTTPSIAEGACTGPLRSLEKQAILTSRVVGGKMSQEPPQLIGGGLGARRGAWGVSGHRFRAVGRVLAPRMGYRSPFSEPKKGKTLARSHETPSLRRAKRTFSS